MIQIKFHARKDTATIELLKKTKTLSIQQMIALHTLILTKRILMKKRPESISNKFQDVCQKCK